MLTLPLILAAPVAWLASDRLLLQGLSDQLSVAPDLANRLAAADFPASVFTPAHWQRALLDYQPCVGARIRNEDATAAIQHFSQGLDYSASGAVGFDQQVPSQQSLHQQCLQQLSQQLLYWQGQCFEVRPKRLQEWLTLASVMDVSWVIAQAYCHELNERRLSVSEALHAMLQVQCAVALPKPYEFEQYADNHVHLNGHGHTNASMLDMALRITPDSVPTDSFATDMSLTPKQQKQLNNWPHRQEYSVFESGSLSKLILPKLVRCLGGRLGLEVLSGGNDKISDITLEQLPFIQPEDLTGLYAQPNIDAKPYKQLLCYAEKPQFASQQRWLVWCCGLLLFESSAQRQDFSNYPCFNQQLLGFIRASNVLRNYMVVSGVGLGQFVEFFGFQHSKSGRGVTEAGFDNEPGSFREFRIGPDKIASSSDRKSRKSKKDTENESGYHLRTLPFEKLVNALKHVYPNDNMHFVLHFVRSFPENQDAARNQPRWQRFRNALLQQVHKLQAFHASVTHSDRNDIGKPLVNEGTDSSVDLRKFVRGYDVAGNENELPIEVFCSALRVLRAGKQQTAGEFGKRLPNPFLTVHCGEDFNHILTGLRAIDEAVNFCDYQPGDRLGHALALGLDVTAWATRQKTLYLTVQQHLDNLVWCHYQALHICEQVCEPVGRFNNIVSVLQQKIDYWANYLGLGEYSINDLYQGWKLRRNCPRALELTNASDESSESGGKSTPTIYRDWLPDMGFLNSPEGKRAREVWEHYLKPKAIYPESKADHIVTINCQPEAESCLSGYSQPLQDNISAVELMLYSAIQDYLMEKYSARGVIIEACPTSNIYIGRFEAYHQHPIYRWHPPNLQWLNRGERFNQFGLRKGAVNVCINTDDSALMPTTIANEHRIMRDVAIEHYEVGSHAADDWIARIRKFGVDVFMRSHLS